MGQVGIVDGTSGDDYIVNTYSRIYVDEDGDYLGWHSGSSILEAGSGDDYILYDVDLYDDIDSLYGNDGNDIIKITGEFTNAYVFGGEGDDVIEAWVGAPGYFGILHLSGGSGKDIFDIRSFSWDAIKHGTSRAVYVDDFDASEDSLMIEENLITPYSFNTEFLTLTEREDGFTIEGFEYVARWETPSLYPTGSVVVTGSTWDEFVNAYQHSYGFINGTDDRDLIYRTYTDADGDSISNGADTVYAGGGDDVVYLYRGNDTAYGGDGDDEIYGGRGHNLLHGEAGNDYLHSGKNTSELYGDEGDDTLVAQLNKGGDHILEGGEGADTFKLYAAVDYKTSDVVINDFTIGEDVLEIEGEVIDFDALPEGVSLTQDEDNNAVLTFSDDETVTLLGLDLGGGVVIPYVPLDETPLDEPVNEEDVFDIFVQTKLRSPPIMIISV